MRYILLLAFLIPLGALSAQRPDSSLASAIDAQMSGGPFNHPEHIELTPARKATKADSARAKAIVDSARKSLGKYRDIAAAKRDGFQIFAPDVAGQKVYHYNHYAWAMANEVHFDPAKPSSLLYEKTTRGEWRLVGVMYTAPADATFDELDQRVPLGIARWHRHVNFCIPAVGGRQRWSETRNGRPLFGPLGVATRAECEAVGGRFLPRVFGWMVHASAFTDGDPIRAWADDHADGGHEH